MSIRARSGQSRWLDAIDRVPDGSVVALAVISLIGGYFVVEVSDSAVSVSRHVLYVPIVLLAVRFGAAVGVGSAVVAAVIAGPLVATTEPAVWLGRGAAFVLVGLIVGAFSSARLRSLRRESDVAERERALTAQRTALVQIISHELRTPLTVLRGSVETLIIRDAQMEAGPRALICAMERSVRRLQDMVDVTLAATDELGSTFDTQKDVDVAALVEHAVTSLPRGLRRRLQVDIPAEASLVTVESPLWLIVRCLLDNADKFSPEDGVVRVGFVEDDHLAVISIEDDGPGLPEGFADEAFEPFVQADASERRVHPGLGMGLYTARRLARKLGGDVVLTARQRAPGSLAQVRLPKNTASPQADGPFRTSGGPIGGSV